MSLSGTQKSRLAVGGPGLRYDGFTDKVVPSPRGTVGPFTRLAVGGPGLRYAGFTAKGIVPEPPEEVSHGGGILRPIPKWFFFLDELLCDEEEVLIVCEFD